MKFTNEIARRLTAPITITTIKNDVHIDDCCATINFDYLGRSLIAHWSYEDGFSVPNCFNDVRVSAYMIKNLSQQTSFNNHLLEAL